MSGWIKFEKDLLTDPRFLRMMKAHVTHARITHTQAATQLVGALVVLWCYADTHGREDDTLDLGADEINELVGIEWFVALMPADWLEILDTHRVKLPGFQEHNGTEAKKLALTQKRVARHRVRNVTHVRSSSEVDSNAGALPDQTRPDQKRPDQSKSAHAVPRGTNNDDSTDHAEWETTLALYPPGAQRSDLIGAERAARNLVESGDATWEQLREGVTRYAACCKATNRLVLNPVKFFTDRDKPWSQAWPIPATKADLRLVGNISAAEEFMRRTEPQS